MQVMRHSVHRDFKMPGWPVRVNGKPPADPVVAGVRGAYGRGVGGVVGVERARGRGVAGGGGGLAPLVRGGVLYNC